MRQRQRDTPRGCVRSHETAPTSPRRDTRVPDQLRRATTVLRVTLGHARRAAPAPTPTPEPLFERGDSIGRLMLLDEGHHPVHAAASTSDRSTAATVVFSSRLRATGIEVLGQSTLAPAFAVAQPASSTAGASPGLFVAVCRAARDRSPWRRRWWPDLATTFAGVPDFPLPAASSTPASPTFG